MIYDRGKKIKVQRNIENMIVERNMKMILNWNIKDDTQQKCEEDENIK